MRNKKIVQKVVLAAVIMKNKKVLILQRSSNEEIFPNMWELPSGKKEFLENSEKCLKREVKEETGLDIKVLFPISIFDYQIEKPNEIRDSTQINFLAKPTKKQKIKLSKEHQKFAWIEEKQINKYKLSKKTKKVIKKAFEMVKKLNVKI